MLTKQQGQVLIRLVRQTICDKLQLPYADGPTEEELRDPDLLQHCGVFVTLNKRGQLRGCIGSLTAVESIADGVRRHALNAAFNDYRFQPLTADEYPDLSINISILSNPEDLKYTDAADLVEKMRPDIDGVIIKAANGAGATFLPQVWKQLPTPELFLGHLCRKAGLADNYWRDGQLDVQTYQVQYFEE